MKTPLERYQDDLKRPEFNHDPAQEQAVIKLQQLYDELLRARQRRTQPLARLQAVLPWTKSKPVRGLYLWGGVGRGKTYLVDTFYDALPFQAKMRSHFHRFMQRIHHELKLCKGEKNPLVLVARKLAQEAEVICFDEFFVKDITDAMILAGLLRELFANGVTLVATSNIIPAELYKDGLQRARFLPAIDLLNEHTEVINVDAGIDYRLRVLTQAQLYHYPLNDEAEHALRDNFEQLRVSAAKVQDQEALTIEGRSILAERVCDGIAWFRFEQLCDGPRSQNDYIELARIFHTVILAGVPCFKAGYDDQARRFISLVDEFYDCSVKLIISAEVAMAALYAEGQLAFEFQRTLSRLQEMQSHEYLARAHKP